VFVVATAGHVDHGKSTLVRALTGMEPDRWAEERRRGMTIDLGFAWTDLPSGATVSFVDVPGHERFVPTMLAGVGPVPAVMFVVAADGGWMPQSAEHLATLDGLGVRHGVLVVTRGDLADPGPTVRRCVAELDGTSLRGSETVVVSATTGAGLDVLRAALDRLCAGLPPADHTAPVRLWVDRCFTIRGSGTVVTGTLAAGRLRTGDVLEVAGTGRRVGVRRLHTLGAEVAEIGAVARVGLNLRGIGHDELARGDALVAPDRFVGTDQVDVRLAGPAATLPAMLMLHVGAAAVPVRPRQLGADTARLRLSRPLPLVVGDRAVLRDPGRRSFAGAVTVLDVAPPALTGRGTAAARAVELATMDGRPDAVAELRRRRVIRRADLERMGVPVTAAAATGDWLVDPVHHAWLRERLAEEVARYAAAHPLETGPPLDSLRRILQVPDVALVDALVEPPLRVSGGRVTRDDRADLPPALARAVERLRDDLTARPFAAPSEERLAELGLGAPEIAAAERAGLLLRVADQLVLLPDAPSRAVTVLSRLDQPFTVSAARTALDTTRRLAIPLLDLLGRQGLIRRHPDDRRSVTASAVDTP